MMKSVDDVKLSGILATQRLKDYYIKRSEKKKY